MIVGCLVSDHDPPICTKKYRREGEARISDKFLLSVCNFRPATIFVRYLAYWCHSLFFGEDCLPTLHWGATYLSAMDWNFISRGLDAMFCHFWAIHFGHSARGCGVRCELGAARLYIAWNYEILLHVKPTDEKGLLLWMCDGQAVIVSGIFFICGNKYSPLRSKCQGF